MSNENSSMTFNKLESFGGMSEDREKVLSVVFNQDYTCLAVATTRGFKVYSLAQQNNLIKLFENKNIGVVSLISMMFRANVLAIVTRQEKIKEEELVSSQMYISDSWSIQDYRNSIKNKTDPGMIPRRHYEYEKHINHMGADGH